MGNVNHAVNSRTQSLPISEMMGRDREVGELSHFLSFRRMIGKQIVNFLYEDFSAVTEAILKIFDVLKSSRSLLEIIFTQYKPTFRSNTFCTPYFENVPPACRLSGILQHLRSEYIERTICGPRGVICDQTDHKFW